MVKVTDSDFNKKLKGRENKIGQFIHFPVRCLEGVAVSDINGDLITINGKAFGKKFGNQRLKQLKS